MPVYVLHFDPPYHHASHYIGFTSRSVTDRVAEHLASRGSPLVAAAIAGGHRVTVAHSWRCGTRLFERYLKNRKETGRWCKCCSGGRRKPKPTFAAFQRALKRGVQVRPSRHYFALAAFSGASPAEMAALSADERRELDQRMRERLAA